MQKTNLPAFDIKASPVIFIKQVRAELKKVTWPTRQEAIRLTIIVLIFSVIVAVYIGSLDFVFTKVIEFIIKR